MNKLTYLRQIHREKALAKQQTAEIIAFPIDAMSGVTTTQRMRDIIPEKPISFLPTAMTRTSPFFPLSKRYMKDRPFEKLEIITPWGSMTQKGETLSIYDETILLNLLFLMDVYKADSFLTTLYEICRIMGVTMSSDQYESIWMSLERLAGTNITIDTPQLKMGGALVSLWAVNKETKQLGVRLNRHIIQIYQKGMGLTNLDIRFRLSIKGDISKSLYRFLQGQQPFYRSGKYIIGMVKLCQALNVQTDNIPLYDLRSKIRKAGKELVNKDYLDTFKIDKNEVCHFKKGVTKKLSRKKDHEEMEKPKQEQITPSNDNHPEITKSMTKFYVKKCKGGIGSINQTEEKKLILASLKLYNFYKEYEKRIDYHFIKTTDDRVELLFEALFDRFIDSKVHVGNLCSDYTYETILPIYLQSQAVLKEDYDD